MTSRASTWSGWPPSSGWDGCWAEPSRTPGPIARRRWAVPFAENDGVKIRWEEQGSGPPLLLIMGLGYTLDMWYRQLPALAERRRVLVFDNRGVGESDVPDGPYTMAQMAGDALAVLDDARVDRCHVLGASLGGAVAQELVLSYPDRVRSLVLACTTCGGPRAEAAAPEVLEILQAR